MASGSGIEWTEATWNPSTGCTKVSPGCKNCYAETMSKRLRAMGQPKYRKGFTYVEHLDEVDLPLSWKKPRRIFVNSMSDLFHEDSTTAFTARCFDTMLRADWHTYQVLTKRPDRMAEFSGMFADVAGCDIPGFVWMGTSVESSEFTYRLDELRRVRCMTRFASFEPLLGPLGRLDLSGIDWAIIGGESGPGHRPVEEEWILGIIDQCKRQKVAVFFKQWGGPRPKSRGRRIRGRTYSAYPRYSKRNPLRGAGLDVERFELVRPGRRRKVPARM
ncbi:MAG: phage Gp37/Gp68 family protein [Nitrosopumilus sp.]|nr:phage Gp37/Gp68 family protein [Nitrosopumilus sp.]